MFSIIKSGGIVQVGKLNKYMCDTEDDIAKLPTNCRIFSSAYVIETGNEYILNHRREWKKRIRLWGNSGSGSGGGTGDAADLNWESIAISDSELDEILNS